MNTLYKWVVGAGALMGCMTMVNAASAEGFELGARLGYGIPMGEVTEGTDLSDGISGQVPLSLDIGYRVIDPLFIGVYMGYGFGILPSDQSDACDEASLDCSVGTFDLGVQAQYHLAPGSGTDFWFGGGLGYESLSASQEGGGTEISTVTSGFPQIMLQLGLDLGSDPKLGFGPFLRFTHATYADASIECDGAGCGFLDGSTDGEIPDDVQSGHQWLTLGFRGTFVL